MLNRMTILFLALALASVAFAADPPDAYQVSYAANLNVGDSFVNVTNAGTFGGFDPAGTICANVYVFDSDQQLAACCAMDISPNGLKGISVRNTLTSNTLTPKVPTEITVALLASAPVGGKCDAKAPGELAPGLRAWSTTIHALQVPPAPVYLSTEVAFQQAGLSASQLAKMTQWCGFIQATGSGYGICKTKGIDYGALGAIAK